MSSQNPLTPQQNMDNSVTLNSIGSLAGAFGKYQTGQAMQSMYGYQAQTLEGAANSALNAGISEANKFSTHINQLSSNQRAAMAANGTDAASGSNVNVEASTIGQAEMDRLTILYNANLKAWGLNQQAALAEMAGKNAATAGTVNAANTLLAGASQNADIWNKWRLTSMGKEDSSSISPNAGNYQEDIMNKYYNNQG